MNDLLAAELSLHLGREPYERKGETRNHRNGYRSRKLTMKGLGTLELRLPRDRDGGFRTGLVPEPIQYDPRIEQDLQMLFLGGASTRTVELMSERLFGRKLSSGEVSQANKKLLEPVEQWRQRSLAGEQYLYLFRRRHELLDAPGDEVVKQCVLVVIGVTEARERRVLALQAGDRESASAWKAVFQDLVQRGLDPSTLRLGVMDGLPGLERTFRSAFRRAKVQRCQFHKAGNVLAKVRRKDQAAVKADLHQIFYAGRRLAAKRALERFASKWKAIYPDAVAGRGRSAVVRIRSRGATDVDRGNGGPALGRSRTRHRRLLRGIAPRGGSVRGCRGRRRGPRSGILPIPTSRPPRPRAGRRPGRWECGRPRTPPS
jgi:putative transposase